MTNNKGFNHILVTHQGGGRQATNGHSGRANTDRHAGRQGGGMDKQRGINIGHPPALLN